MEKSRFRWLFRWSPVSVFIIVMIYLCGSIFYMDHFQHKIETKIEKSTVNIEIVEEFRSGDFPHDIMRVKFHDEIWIYRLFEDGLIKKITIKEEVETDNPH